MNIDKWIKVPDNKIKNRWQCSQCNQILEIHPDYYKKGLPTCKNCNTPMTYKSFWIKQSIQKD